jgi:putative hydrolase of HD superfamily
MAMFALLLQKELNIEINIEHTLKLILTHDLVEIYAGDTPAFDETGHRDKEEREERAAQALFTQLPEDLSIQLYDWWKEFEACKTPEARYARAVDKLQSFAQNIFSQGRNWREHGVTAEKSRMLNRAALEFDSALTQACELLYQRGVDEQLWPD